MGPEFENGDGRLRPSRQQRLPGAEGPPEGRSTAPRHTACGGPIPRSRGPVLICVLFELLTAQDIRVAKGSARKAPASQTRYHWQLHDIPPHEKNIIKIRAYRGIFVRRRKLLVRRSTRRPGKPSAGANMRKPRTSAESVLSDGAITPPRKQPVDACGSRGHGRNDASPAALTRARALRDGNARSSRPPRQPLSTPPAYR